MAINKTFVLLVLSALPFDGSCLAKAPAPTPETPTTKIDIGHFKVSGFTIGKRIAIDGAYGEKY